MRASFLHRILFVFSLLLLGFGNVVAQKFEANVSQNPVSVGDRFKLNFVLENTTGKITPPALTDFVVIFGPSQSSNFSYINGKSSRTITVSYVLMAENPGTYTIGAAKASTEDGDFVTSPIDISVTKGSAQNTSSTTRSGNSQSSTAVGPAAKAPASGGNVIIQVVPSKTTAYIGEPVLIDYVLYSRYSQLELGETNYPALSGFWVENIDLGNVKWADRYTTINGMRYRKATIKRQLLYPQRSGKLSIPSFTQNVVVNRSFFNPGSKVSADSKPVTLDIKSYPKGAPSNFSNVTGSFRIASDVSKTTVATNDAITYKLKISGNGNLKLLNAPEINFPSDFEVYEPKTNDKFAVTGNGIQGSKEWEYILIPRYPGEYQIPEVRFSFFNPNTKKYQTIVSDVQSLTVTGEASNVGGTVVNPKSDVALLNKDIRFIDTDWQPSTGGGLHAAKGIYWLVVLFMVSVGLGASLYVRKQQSLKQNTVVYKQRKAGKQAERQLSKAKSHLKSGDAAAFYVAVVDALHGFVQDKFNANKTQLSRESLKQLLLEKGASEEQFLELQQLIDDCDMARYAPSANVNMDSTYERAKNTLQWLGKLSA